MYGRALRGAPLWVLSLLFFLLGCETTTLSTTWRDPSAGALTMRKVMIVVLNSSPAERRAQEDALAAEIRRVEVQPSYHTVSDDLLRDVPAAKQRIIESGADGALVFRLLDMRQESTYVPPTISTWDDGWGYASATVTPGYTYTDTFVRAEINLYSAPSGRLIWAAASETVNPANAREFAVDVMKAAAAELRKQGLTR